MVIVKISQSLNTAWISGTSGACTSVPSYIADMAYAYKDLVRKMFLTFLTLWLSVLSLLPWPLSFQAKEPVSPQPVENAHVLLYLGDSVTTDHISPAGSIARSSAAAKYLTNKG